MFAPFYVPPPQGPILSYCYLLFVLGKKKYVTGTTRGKCLTISLSDDFFSSPPPRRRETKSYHLRTPSVEIDRCMRQPDRSGCMYVCIWLDSGFNGGQR